MVKLAFTYASGRDNTGIGRIAKRCQLTIKVHANRIGYAGLCGLRHNIS